MGSCARLVVGLFRSLITEGKPILSTNIVCTTPRCFCRLFTYQDGKMRRMLLTLSVAIIPPKGGEMSFPASFAVYPPSLWRKKIENNIYIYI